MDRTYASTKQPTVGLIQHGADTRATIVLSNSLTVPLAMDKSIIEVVGISQPKIFEVKSDTAHLSPRAVVTVAIDAPWKTRNLDPSPKLVHPRIDSESVDRKCRMDGLQDREGKRVLYQPRQQDHHLDQTSNP